MLIQEEGGFPATRLVSHDVKSSLGVSHGDPT